ASHPRHRDHGTTGGTRDRRHLAGAARARGERSPQCLWAPGRANPPAVVYPDPRGARRSGARYGPRDGAVARYRAGDGIDRAVQGVEVSQAEGALRPMPYEAYIGYLTDSAQKTRHEVQVREPFVIELRD